MIVEAVLIIALGVAAGMVAGLFGVGGGTIFVPTLTLVLGLSQLHAEATSLLAIIPVAMLGSWRQTREGTVRWTDATIIGLVSVATAIAGALIADVAPERALRLGFALLLVSPPPSWCCAPEGRAPSARRRRVRRASELQHVARSRGPRPGRWRRPRAARARRCGTCSTSRCATGSSPRRGATRWRCSSCRGV